MDKSTRMGLQGMQGMQVNRRKYRATLLDTFMIANNNFESYLSWSI